VRAMRFPAQQHRACLLLGSNIQPEENLRKAVHLLRQNFQVERGSGVWESAAVGSEGPNFLNAAVIIRTSLKPQQLKESFLRPLEARLGRVRTMDKNASRTIDIDIVAWDADIVDANVWKFAHAAVPVAELLPCYQSEATGEYLEQRAAYLSRSTHIFARREVPALFPDHRV
jgi:2-amino-4-hydroxy-6-hydroxymethyldihydropteridine diphosphokinase